MLEGYKQLAIRSEVQAITEDVPVIGILAKENEQKTQAFIEFCIVELLTFLNVNRTMNEMQIRETARLIVLRYNYLKISDVRLVFDEIKTGQVKLYEGIDSSKILGAFESWSQRRWKVAEDYNFHRHQDHISNEKKNRDKPFPWGNDGEPVTQVPDERYFEKTLLK